MFSINSTTKMDLKLQKYYKEYVSYYMQLKQDKSLSPARIFNQIDDLISQNENLSDRNKQQLTHHLKEFHENLKKYSYGDHTDNSDKYLTKKTMNFSDWKKSR
jgi:hypothetical protein